MITFDGIDVDSGNEWLAVPVINIWQLAGYDQNAIVATVEHGTSGELLERQGNRCKVKVGDIVGYVTFWFIKELKADWLEGRKKGRAL